MAPGARRGDGATERCAAQAAAQSGSKFTVQGDTWKPKMKRRKHYLAVLLDWTGADWNHVQVCIDVVPMPIPRTAEAYRDSFLAALAKV